MLEARKQYLELDISTSKNNSRSITSLLIISKLFQHLNNDAPTAFPLIAMEYYHGPID
jgi:hypothetical protein